MPDIGYITLPAIDIECMFPYMPFIFTGVSAGVLEYVTPLILVLLFFNLNVFILVVFNCLIVTSRINIIKKIKR